jgi:hypothetical protein
MAADDSFVEVKSARQVCDTCGASVLSGRRCRALCVPTRAFDGRRQREASRIGAGTVFSGTYDLHTAGKQHRAFATIRAVNRAFHVTARLFDLCH